MGILIRNKQKVDKSRLPNHMAFIIDGNGRWANKRGLPRTVGHKYGVEAVKNTVENCLELGIKVISFYTFSTENWNRPKEEIDQLFKMLRDYIDEDTSKYEARGIKFMTSGDLSKLPKDIIDAVKKAKEKTKNNTKMIVNIAINYGGRQEIIRAVNSIIKKGIKEVTVESFKNYLYTSGLPELDFLVRTSGELRLSNFMLYQTAYSEFYFPKVYWPAFNKKELNKALIAFQSRKRRFGSIKK